MWLQAAMIAAKSFGSFMGQKSKNKSLDINAKIAKSNAVEFRKRAKDALARGSEEVGGIHRERDRNIGTQQAKISGSGVSVNSGSAIDNAMDSKKSAAADATTARRNAENEANGEYASANQSEYEASNYEAQQKSAWLAAGETALMGALNMGIDAHKTKLASDAAAETIRQQTEYDQTVLGMEASKMNSPFTLSGKMKNRFRLGDN